MRDVITVDGAKKHLVIPDARDAGFHLMKELDYQHKSQTWLAQHTGYSKQLVNRMCNGEAMKIEFLAEAAKVLGADEVVIKVRR